MIRILTGSLAALTLALGLAVTNANAASEGGHGVHIDRQTWTFGGFTGQYDPAQLQRGFQIYKEVCSACHGLKRVRFRNLFEPGGPEFPEDAVKALAHDWPNKIVDGPDDEGKMFEREPKAFDPILGPFKNDKEARSAQNGALPPDLSLVVKARNVEYTGSWWAHPFSMLRDIATGYQEGGADYLYALLIGYAEAPADVKLAEGMHYNAVFPGHQIAMPQPLAKDNFITYQDGKGSLEQNAADVSAFLAWAADPHLNSRKGIGWLVMLYLVVTTGLLYAGKRLLWSKIPH
ncbi:cytochrome c1 [Hyphomicrobium sp.]|uniref:cytochrome c1 n=1 Tax=Hyphomicrobium sp. TaxID=82 RepID=UPI002E31119A|nr:cytochrome c1 [Hyphomicrobium sp.]HEX2840405.1 cytochrome c1 [Hyphomicrobium sp.]